MVASNLGSIYSEQVCMYKYFMSSISPSPRTVLVCYSSLLDICDCFSENIRKLSSRTYQTFNVRSHSITLDIQSHLHSFLLVNHQNLSTTPSNRSRFAPTEKPLGLGYRQVSYHRHINHVSQLLFPNAQTHLQLRYLWCLGLQ